MEGRAKTEQENRQEGRCRRARVAKPNNASTLSRDNKAALQLRSVRLKTFQLLADQAQGRER